MRVEGSIRAPGDKSITHRALIIAALSRTRVQIVGALTAADAKSTARVLRQLGAGVGQLRRGQELDVRGKAWKKPKGTLNCGNSGTTARLILGCLAGHRFESRLTGDASLRRRPMRRVTGPLVAMGATVKEGAGNGLPLSIRGGCLSSSCRFQSPVASAQVKSAILLAGLTGGVPVTVVEPARSRDHTECLFTYLGFDLLTKGREISFRGAGDTWPRIESFDLQIPGDVSSAAFLVGAALLADSGQLLIENVGVNPTRSGFLEVLRRMGASVRVENLTEVCGEKVADLVICPARLRGTVVKAGEIPALIDEVPLLAGLAARAEGETTFRSVGELRVKESNRLVLIAENLRSLGVNAEVDGDDLVVAGSDRPLKGRVDTARDHRLAMTFAVLGTTKGANIVLSESGSAGVSYPGFFEDLARVVSR
jgi:3-phosphoshikimate 1-carboxyvinyltransferase